MTTKLSIKALAALLAAGAISLAASTAGYAHGGGSHGGSNSGGNSTAQPVHGPGSSHNPIVYHPVHGPGSSHNPILATKPVVRDHRHHDGPHGGLGPNGGASTSSSEGGVVVTSGSGRNKVVVPTKVGDETVHALPGNGLYNPPPPIVHDHR